MNRRRRIFARPPTGGALPRLALALALVGAVLIPALFGRSVPSVSAEIVGNTYTSPTFGSTITWDNNWFVIEEQTLPMVDILRITNGLTQASFFVEEYAYPSPDLAIAILSADFRTDPQVTNVVPITDATGAVIRGSEPSQAYAAYSYTYTAEDGSTGAFGTYIEARVINDGKLLLTTIAISLIDYFFADYQLPGITLPEPAIATAPQFVDGEAGPVFADGFWRIGVATAAQGADLPGLGLARKEGKDWIVAIVDVTNWSDRSRDFSARDVRLSVAGARKPVRIAPASTASVGKRLELTALNDGRTPSVPPGETRRIALVYSVPSGSAEPHLTIGQGRLPIVDLLELQIDGDALPPQVKMPQTAIGTIASASDGQSLRVQIAGEADSQRFRLLGVEAPAKGSCLANGGEKLLDGLAGRRVFVEEDSAVTGGRAPLRYVWLVNADGSRTLLNQKLIADGLAHSAPIPDDARFGLWLLTSERDAEASETGLWAGCDEPKATVAADQPSPSLTPETEETDPATDGTTWHGEINMFGTVDFTIENGTLTQMSIAYSMPCTHSGASYTGSGSTFGTPQKLVDDQFSVTFPFTWDLIGTISGTVMSETSIVGTVTIPVMPGCTTEEMQLRWTAAPV